MKQEIGLLIAFLLVFLFDTFASARAQRATGWVAFVTMLFATAVCFCPMAWQPASIFGGMYVTAPVYEAIKLILNLGVLIVMLQAMHWSDSEFVAIRRGEFYELLMLTLFGMYLMISAKHFLLFVIGLETASLPLAAMVAFNKNKYESHEAAVKYVLTAVFSSAILMMGLSFIYALSGTLYYNGIGAMMYAYNGGVALMVVGLAFIISGFGFKLSLVPFHLWTADVYEGAPTVVTSYLSVISKGSAAFAFLMVLMNTFGAVYEVAWEWMMYAVIILTITVGNLFAIRQTNLKRFLAFSSISQAGYIMLAIMSDDTIGVAALMFYVLVYIFSNLGAFGVVSAMEQATGRLTMTEYNGLYKTNPRLAFTMMLAMFSLAGIPPFAGFFSKFFIFTAALSQGSIAIYVLVLIALINTIVSLYYYLLVVKAMFINDSENPAPTFRSACTERVAMWICLAGIIGLGIVSWVYSSLLELPAIF